MTPGGHTKRLGAGRADPVHGGGGGGGEEDAAGRQERGAVRHKDGRLQHPVRLLHLVCVCVCVRARARVFKGI